MAKFLFLTNHGDGLGLAFHLKNLGHTVGVHIRPSSRAQNNFDGMLLKFNDKKQWEKWIDKTTTIVFDANGGGVLGDRLRSQGYNVFGGSVFADQMELDRETGFEFMRQVGIKFPETETFTSWEDGEAFARANSSKKWVFKPSGETAANDAIGSYVPSDVEDLAEMMNYWKQFTSTPEYVLQEFLEGVCISTEGWFNGQEWMTPFNHTVERKQLMNGNLGGSGGCSGNAVWKAFGSNHIIEEGVKLIGPILKDMDYRGPIDLNTVVNEQGVWALEWTPRFGYDALPAFIQLYEGDVGELLASIARGDHPTDLNLKSGFASALRISVPPYPAEQFKHAGGIPIRGWEKSDRDHIFLYEVKLNENDTLVTSPAYGAVAALTGYGDSVCSSFDVPLELAGKAKIPDKQYRTDITEVLNKDLGEFNRLVEVRMHVHKEVE